MNDFTMLSKRAEKGAMIGPKYRRYRIEPGDATRYEFYIVWLHTTSEPLLHYVVSGVNSTYITLGIRDHGSYEFMIDSIRSPIIPLFLYAFTKFPNVNRWDVVACILAASVLVDNPTAIDEAAQRMLETPHLIEELLADGYNAEDYE